MNKNSERATWVIHLFSTCPVCGEDVDLLDDPEFDYSAVKLGEHGTKDSTDMEVYCPECNAAFFVTLEY